MIKVSSAYINVLNFYIINTGSQFPFCRIDGISCMYRLKRNGRRLHPCHVPTLTGNNGPRYPSLQIWACNCSYILLIILINLGFNLDFTNSL